jgi:hypothetical protein
MKSRSAAALLLALTLSAGCGGAEEVPRSLPPVTAAPSASASPSLAVPSAATAETPQGAAEFARFWFATLNAAARTGDTAELRAISAPDCQTCDAFAKSIEDLYGPGGRIEGGVFTVVAAEAPALEPGATSARVTVIYDVSPTKQVGANGEELRSTPALKGVDGDMELRRVAGEWRASTLMTS